MKNCIFHHSLFIIIVYNSSYFIKIRKNMIAKMFMIRLYSLLAVQYLMILERCVFSIGMKMSELFDLIQNKDD